MSARTGEGLDALRAQILASTLREMPEPASLNAAPAAADDDIAAAATDFDESEGEDLRDGTYHSHA